MTKPEFDIVLFGATSFVGQITARYMHGAYADEGLSWAVAGRSEGKLARVIAENGLDGIPRILADSHDEASLRAMCERARVVVSTVGPYALYGETLVKVCADTGTHYCDLTGEPHWIREMVGRYAETARANGARIVHCCGFDSIPSDLGVHLLQNHAIAHHGGPCERVDMRVMKAKGGASGGTVASLIAMVKEASGNAELRRELKNPYSLCPPDHPYTVRQPNVGVEYDERIGGWVGPFIMAAINTRIVHRSNALSGNRYGTSFRYEEATATGRGGKGKRRARLTRLSLKALMMGLAIAPVRWAMNKLFLPSPGEGPSPEAQRKGHFDLLFLGTAPDGTTLRARVTGDKDPGYGSTAEMLGQAAACLARDVGDDAATGFCTPATLLGDALIDRLQARAGLTFAVENHSST